MTSNPAFLTARINSLPVTRLRRGITPPEPAGRRRTCAETGAGHRQGTAQSLLPRDASACPAIWPACDPSAQFRHCRHEIAFLVLLNQHGKRIASLVHLLDYIGPTI